MLRFNVRCRSAMVYRFVLWLYDSRFLQEAIAERLFEIGHKLVEWTGVRLF